MFPAEKTRNGAPKHIHGPFRDPIQKSGRRKYLQRKKPSERTQHCSRLLLYIHKHPASPHYQPRNNTIQVGHSAVLKSLPAMLRAARGGPLRPRLRSRGLRPCCCQKTEARSGSCRQGYLHRCERGELFSRAERGGGGRELIIHHKPLALFYILLKGGLRRGEVNEGSDWQMS